MYEQFYSHLTQLLTCPSSDTLNYRTYSLAASQSKGSNDNSEIREDCEACESNNITGSSESRESRVSVSLREERAVISSGTTGLCSWPAGEALATWVGGQGQARWRGSKVIELGAGAGMAGIYTIKRSPVLLLLNIALNCCCISVVLHCFTAALPTVAALLYYRIAAQLHCCTSSAALLQYYCCTAAMLHCSSRLVLCRWGHVLSEVVLTDCHTAVLRNLEHNVTRNLQEHFTTVEEDPLELRCTQLNSGTMCGKAEGE